MAASLSFLVLLGAACVAGNPPVTCTGVSVLWLSFVVVSDSTLHSIPLCRGRKCMKQKTGNNQEYLGKYFRC